MFHDWRWREYPTVAVCANCGLQAEEGVPLHENPEEAFRLTFECRDVQAWNVGQIEEG